LLLDVRIGVEEFCFNPHPPVAAWQEEPEFGSIDARVRQIQVGGLRCSVP
jgi:hypothetical protein